MHQQQQKHHNHHSLMRMGKSYSSSSIARGCRSSLVDGIVRHWSALGGVGGRASGDASSMRFTKILKQHWGCVNALALGRKTDIAGCDDGVGASTGEVLLTGGDDTRILVWNIRNHEPVASFLGHQSNIFSIAVGSHSPTIISSGNDGLICRFDMQHSPFPINESPGVSKSNATEIFMDHEAGTALMGGIGDGILKVSIQSMNDAAFLTASQDGTIRLYDARVSTHAQQMMQFRSEQNCVQFHPFDEKLFLVSDTQGHLSLFDLRSSLRNSSGRRNSSTLSNSHYKNTLVSYNTRLCVGRNNLSIPIDIPSVSFNHDGSLICALFQRWFPTLYALNDPDPLCVFRTGSHVDFRPPIIPLTSPNAATALSPGGEGGGDTGITYTTAFAASSSSYRAPALFSTNNCISLPSTATQASFTTRLTAFQEHELCFEPNNQFGTGYRTFTTLKSASFCRFSPDTTTSEYFFAGSEDCNIYGWKVPSRREMEEARMLYAPPGGGGGHAGSSIRSTCGDGGGNGLSTSMMDDKGTTAAAAAAVSSSSSSTLSSSSLKSSSPLKKRKIVDEKEGDEKGYDEFRQNHTQSPPPQPPTPLALPPPPPNEAFYVHRPTSLSKQNRQQDDDQSYRVGPLHIDKCDFIIKGRHRSLVNNVLCHPTQPLVYGSGVEKVVLAHSPLPFPETVVGDDPPTVVEFEERPRVYTRQHQINFLLAGHPWGRSDDSSSDEDEEEGNLSDEDVEEGQEDELNEDGEQTAVVTSSPTVHPPPIHQLDLGTTNPHDIQPQQQNEQQSSAYTTSREQRQRLRRRSRTDESLSTLVLFDALVASELNQTARIFPKAYLRSSWLRRYEGGDGGEGRGGRGIGSDESGGQHQAHQQRHHHIQDSSSEDF